MGRAIGRHRGRTVRRGGARALLSAVWALTALTAVNCRCNDIEQPEPPVIQDVPIVRVLLTAAAADEVRVGTTGGYSLQADGRTVAEADEALAPVTVRHQSGGWRVGPWRAAGRELVVRPAPGRFVRFDGVTYRGWLRLVPADGGRLLAINHVDVEGYLAGVLAKELYRTWAPATYRALAVAARTFALYHMTTSGVGKEYDLGSTQASQVYGGLPGETSRSREAVRHTHGTVLAYGPDGQERIFLAQYSACCGGRVNGAYVIRKARLVPPLRGGQVCTDCRACRRYRWGAVRIAKSDIHRALVARYGAAARLGGLSAIRVQTTTPHGRAVWVDAVGPTGQKVRLRAEDIRLALLFGGVPAAKGLYSMNCRLVDRGGSIEFADGRGFGHGVGLCQWGAQGKAMRGWTAEQILQFYYPGAKLYRVH
ncbi:MAG TPA: SpoIID/LytB domain-containing protein [Phycisphaerae bacterium]|nr:SpoIID/LytB domain-containing protein [Phycisphaerae bacterium]